jgi:hypothetical protein
MHPSLHSTPRSVPQPFIPIQHARANVRGVAERRAEVIGTREEEKREKEEELEDIIEEEHETFQEVC